MSEMPAHTRPPEGVPRRQRLITAALLAFLLLAVGAVVGLTGLAAGVMGTDGCTETPSMLYSSWLLVVFPLAVLATSLVPPILIARGRSWKWALAALAAGSILTIVVWLLWIPILDLVC